MANRFSSVFSANKPPNLFLLPAFTSQELLPDGVFLNPVSGLHYSLHLFDQAEIAISTVQASSEEQMAVVREDVRQGDDRVAYLEHRHVHLQRRLNLKIAIDSEFDDWMLNRSEEDWLTVQRLKRLPKMSGQDWQSAARQQVSELIKTVLSLNRVRVDFEVLLVVNPLRHITTGPTLYHVRMDSIYSSSRIRELFSGFFRRNRPLTIPPHLKNVGVRNKITLATKVRIAILHQLGSVYTASNQGSSYKVRGFDPRPKLITEPAKNSGDRIRNYTFIQAATTLKATFSDEHLIRIYQVVGNNFQGELQALFIVLNDDDRERCLELVKANREQQQQQGGHSQRASVNFMPVQSTCGVVHGSGAGMEVQAKVLESLRDAPPPPDTPPPSYADLAQTSDADDRSSRPSRDDRSPAAARSSRSRSRESRYTPPRSTKGDKRSPERDSKPAKKKSKRRRSSSSSSSGSSDSSSSSSSSSSRGRSRKKYRSKGKSKSRSKKSRR